MMSDTPPVSLLVVAALCCGACAGAVHEDEERRGGARLRAAAERFLVQWMEASQLQGSKPKCAFRDRDFNDTLTGWYTEFHCPNPQALVFVSHSQKMVVCLLTSVGELRPPRREGERVLSPEERKAAVRPRIRFSLGQARERAERFLAAVYPDFQQRRFAIQRQELVYREWVAYCLQWEEACDLDRPTTLPNEIDVRVNPETGVILDYDAENYSLPEGFRLGLTAEGAVKKAEASLQSLVSKPWFKPLKDPGVSLMYLPARETGARDRVAWAVVYSLERKGGGDTMYPLRVFDAATGARIREAEGE